MRAVLAIGRQTGEKCIKISHVKIQNVRKFHVFACNENKAYLSSARSAIALRLIETSYALNSSPVSRT